MKDVQLMKKIDQYKKFRNQSQNKQVLKEIVD